LELVYEEHLRARLGEAEALEAVERAFLALACGDVVQPPPMGFNFPEASGETHVKGAYIRGDATFAIKVASGFYRNPDKGLAVGSGIVLVLDATTGAPVAMLKDNAFLTELRTAAAGALAVRLLAPVKIDKMAVLGTGVQARYQLRAITRVRDVGEVFAWSPNAERRQSYCEEMSASLGIPFRSVSSAAAACENAGLVLTVTPAREPIVKVKDVSRNTTVVAVGSDGPDKQELDVAILAQADKVVVDNLSQCLALGEVHHAVAAGRMSENDVHAELGDVLAGNKARREGDELIVCDLTGVGAQDAAMAAKACQILLLPCT
jgi:ornithine cyclodeaminase/alanine dehydrogenase-like protein (mu-crystallin family)